MLSPFQRFQRKTTNHLWNIGFKSYSTQRHNLSYPGKPSSSYDAIIIGGGTVITKPVFRP